MGSFDADVEHLSREHVARRRAAADHRGARAVNAGVRPLRAAQAKLHHIVPASGIHHACRLGCDERLMVDEVEQRRFDQLRLHDGRAHAQERLIREHDRALGHAVDFPREAQRAQHVEKILVKEVQRPQIIEVLLGKMELIDIVDDGLRARHYRVSIVFAVAKKQIEHGLVFAHAITVIPVHHRELVQVGHHGQVSCARDVSHG